ncbi:Alpha/Beta hydrolase protein [Xylaria bambusicola]|uniref:Alpha/Beta hydrolase protein n=1 Tax=Xylaria bambusicola TaxID=326684 RepID=UPI002008AC8B|nr:Alpha/Beta hydrolase protein [Xylaria bambusicola]KAI0517033.1 Alpha/Beta hydrolase protein [Xylaria bambusicola]
MDDNTITGEVAFDAPGAGKPCKTWYKVLGNIGASQTPLVALHGGPGAGHDYLAALCDLHEKHGIPIVFYDQIGCGRSTHLREKMGDTSFWTFDLFVRELDNLINHLHLRGGFYLYGSSWGGMLASYYASTSPPGLKKLILLSAPASVPLYVEGCKGLLAGLPEDVRRTLEECDRKGDHESDEFKTAAQIFMKKHVCRVDPMPEAVQRSLDNLKDDPTAYLTMQGPSEFIIIGKAFKDWEGFRFGHKIAVPTLLINGQYDEVQDTSFEPWFHTIPKVRWVTLEGASHMSPWEAHDKFTQIAGSFLTSNIAV